MAAGSGAAREGRLEQCRFWLRQSGLENSDEHYHSGKQGCYRPGGEEPGKTGKSEAQGCPEQVIKFSGL